jgi:HAD superfamily hydrolase (TIGR01548 family)
MKPEALIFDVDDTLVDVTQSYRLATVYTARWFGAQITFEDITMAKAVGDANNDWVLTWDLLKARGINPSLEEVTLKFEEFYQGTETKEGFRKKETLLIDPQILIDLKTSYKLGIITGRPRKDVDNFLREHNFSTFFEAVITMDDGPLKPSMWPMKRAMEILEVSSATMFGDTPDDIKCAVDAGQSAVGVIAPADNPDIARKALTQAGASAVIKDLSCIYEVLSR